METNTLRPGLLVSLKTTVKGNVKYSKETIDAEHVNENGEQVARWQTKRTIFDPIEFEEAKKARGKCRSLVTGVCAASAFGLLCPEINAPKLEAAIKKAREVAKVFNETAKLSRVEVYVITGRVAQDDVEAIRAINSEVRNLLEEMKAGISDLDVKRVRDAASKAKGLGQMLSENAAEKIKEAVEAARAEAKKIAKAGEGVAVEIDQVTFETLASARTAFLDLGDEVEVTETAPVARSVDLTPLSGPDGEAIPSNGRLPSTDELRDPDIGFGPQFDRLDRKVELAS